MRLSPLENVRAGADRLNADWIYSYPTITKLSLSLSKILGLESSTEESDDLLSILKKYNITSPAKVIDPTPAKLDAATPRVVLLTGSTGALGSHLLSFLVQSPVVQRIYCLNRASSKESIQERQRQAFLSQGLDVALLYSSKILLYEGNTTKPGLGLDYYVFKDVGFILCRIFTYPL